MQSSPPAAVAADSALLYISGEVVVGYCHWMVTGWLPKANLMHTQRSVQHRRPRPDRRRGPCRWPRERLASEEGRGEGRCYCWRRRKLLMGGLDGHTGADSAIRRVISRHRCSLNAEILPLRSLTQNSENVVACASDAPMPLHSPNLPRIQYAFELLHAGGRYW